MKTTSIPSRTTALKLVTMAIVSQRLDVAAPVLPSADVALANALRSSWRGMAPAARSTALRSQLRPNSKSRRPMTT